MNISYQIHLDGTQVSSSPVTSASGTGYAIFTPSNESLAYSITISGLDFGNLFGETPQTVTTDDDVTTAHIHIGARGSNGG
jgi:hypothetical protein